MAVSMCSVTSQRDPSPATSGSEFLKRPLPLDADGDFEPPAAKLKCAGGGAGAAGGGGRRKQSKPIRVRASPPPPPVEDDLVIDLKMPGQSPTAATASVDPCRDGQPVDAEFNDDRQPPFLTKYHQLGSELKQEVTSYDGDGDPEAAKSGGGGKSEELVEDRHADLSQVRHLLVEKCPLILTQRIQQHHISLSDSIQMTIVTGVPVGGR